MNMKHGWNYNDEKTEVLTVKPVPVPLSPQQFPHGLNHVMACTLFHLCTVPASLSHRQYSYSGAQFNETDQAYNISRKSGTYMKQHY